MTFWLVYTPRWVILTFGPRRGIEHTPSSSFRLSTCDTCCLNTQLHHSAVGVCSMEIWTRLGGYIEGRRVEVKKTFVTCLSSCSGHIDLLLPHHTFISSISMSTNNASTTLYLQTLILTQLSAANLTITSKSHKTFHTPFLSNRISSIYYRQ